MAEALLLLGILAWLVWHGLRLGSYSPGTSTVVPPTTPITQIAASSGNVAATATTATLAGTANKTTHIEGFDITGAGATSASIIQVTVTGLAAGTLTFDVVIPAGATTAIGGTGNPGVVPIRFPTPLPASAVNTNVVVNVPSFGTGNTAACVTAYGYQL